MDYTKGRNLLLKSGTFESADWAKTRATVPETGIIRVTPTTGSASGKYAIDYLKYGDFKNLPLTFSFDARNVETGTYAGTNGSVSGMIGICAASRKTTVLASASDRYYSVAFSGITTEWQRFSVTIDSLDLTHLPTGPSSYDDDDNCLLTVEVWRAAKIEPAEFRNIKLEIGTEATEYRPAPEDNIAGFDYWILARNSITVSIQRDIDCLWRLYKIASSTLTPTAPTQAEAKTFIDSGTLPSGWSKVEPSYDGTSTNSLYTVDITGYTDGDVGVSDISKSSSYEAAKEAYNKSLAVESDLNATRTWYSICTTEAATVAKVATVDPVTTDFDLHEGVIVFVKFTITNSGAKASLTLNVNGSGAKPIKYIYNGSLSDIPDAAYLKENQTYQFYYDGTNWVVQMIYNTNTNYVDRCQYALSLAASASISAARIAVLGIDGKLHILNTTAFDIKCPPLYVATAYSTTNVNNGTTRATNYRYWGAAFNLSSTHAIEGAAAGKAVYIVGTLDDEIFTPNTTVLTCVEPTIENNLYYMRLGVMNTDVNAVLEMDHPIYVYYDGEFLTLEEAEAGKAKKVATNYLSSDSSGIMVADLADVEQTPSTATGRNVKIDNDSVDIRDGQKILASYGESTLIGDPTGYHVGIGQINYAEVDLSTLSWSTRYTGTVNKTLSTSLPVAYDGYNENIRVICENYSLAGYVGGVGSLSTPDTHDVGFYGYKNSANPTPNTIYMVIPVDSSPSGKMVYSIAETDSVPSIKLYSEDQEVIAKFGNSIVIGNESERHIEIDHKGFQTKLNSSKELIFIGVINDPENGDIAEVIERCEVSEIDMDGLNPFYGFTISNAYTQILNVAYGTSSITNLITMVDDYTARFTSSGSSYNGKFVSVRYYTDELVPCFRFGTNNICRAAYSSAFGISNEIYAPHSLAIGTHCIIYGHYSVAEGDSTSAIGNVSHAEGYSTYARGAYSHSEGIRTQANGYASHAEGDDTRAEGMCSHASGEGTVAESLHQTAIGRYNAIDANDQFSFIIGNGTDDSNRSNAFAVTWDGIPRGAKVQHNHNSSWSLTQYNISGFIDGNSKIIILSLETERFLDTVDTITVESIVGAARGVKGYLDASTYSTQWVGSTYSVEATKKGRRNVEIRISRVNNAVLSNATANTPVSLYATFTLKFYNSQA